MSDSMTEQLKQSWRESYLELLIEVTGKLEELERRRKENPELASEAAVAMSNHLWLHHVKEKEENNG